MKFSDFLSRVKTMDADEVRRWIDEKPEGSYTLLDVREPEEYEEGHIPGALLVPLSELPDRLSEVDPTKPVLTY
jgi:rhodanese-related sulfurtransferase